MFVLGRFRVKRRLVIGKVLGLRGGTLRQKRKTLTAAKRAWRCLEPKKEPGSLRLKATSATVSRPVLRIRVLSSIVMASRKSLSGSCRGRGRSFSRFSQPIRHCRGLVVRMARGSPVHLAQAGRGRPGRSTHSGRGSAPEYELGTGEGFATKEHGHGSNPQKLKQPSRWFR
jgi:hypothetical protein